MNFPRLTTEEFLSQFDLVEVLGHGGFGVTFRAQRQNGEFCAIKLLAVDENDHPDPKVQFQELITVHKVASYADAIPALGHFDEFSIITAAPKLIDFIDSKTSTFVFDYPYCAPLRDEITAFMMYTMPIYFPIEWDTLDLDHQKDILAQANTALKQFATHQIRPVDFAVALDGGEPNYSNPTHLAIQWKNVMFTDASRTQIAIVDCDQYTFFWMIFIRMKKTYLYSSDEEYISEKLVESIFSKNFGKIFLDIIQIILNEL